MREALVAGAAADLGADASASSNGTMTEASSRGSRLFQPSSWNSLAANAMAALNSSFWSPCPVGDSGFMIAYSIG